MPDYIDHAALVSAGFGLAARLLDGDRNDEASKTFTQLNSNGEGFDPDDDLPDWTCVYRARTVDEVSIYADGDDAILVGDAGGSWAVRVSA
jgi:hypothetical protein